MPRKGITVEAIAAAVQRLHSQRRPASPSTVRCELGTGSYTTIVSGLRTLGVHESKRASRSSR